MKKYYQFDDGVDDSIELMISILIRYPEINTVKTDPKSKEIIFSFLLNKDLSQDEFMKIEAKLRDSIETFLFVQNTEPVTARIRTQSYNNYSLIEVIRDFKTITQRELSLLIYLMNSELGSYLLTEHGVSSDVEELEVQEEIIEDLLIRLQYQSQGDLIGFRESGKVMVFHKTSAN